MQFDFQALSHSSRLILNRRSTARIYGILTSSPSDKWGIVKMMPVVGFRIIHSPPLPLPGITSSPRRLIFLINFLLGTGAIRDIESNRARLTILQIQPGYFMGGNFRDFWKVPPLRRRTDFSGSQNDFAQRFRLSQHSPVFFRRRVIKLIHQLMFSQIGNMSLDNAGKPRKRLINLSRIRDQVQFQTMRNPIFFFLVK